MRSFSMPKAVKSQGLRSGVFMLVVSILVLAGSVWETTHFAKGTPLHTLGYGMTLCGVPMVLFVLILLASLTADGAIQVDETGIEFKMTKPFRKVNRILWAEV
jgi:hypothetical protein